jgi:hypothetical protein
MLLPTLWLNDYCDSGLDVGALEERLTMTGTYVERVYTHGVTALENFVVGRVLSAEPHPDADRLTVCMVALGEGAPAPPTRSTSVPVIDRRSASCPGSRPESQWAASQETGTFIGTAPASGRRCRRTSAGRGRRA